MEQIAGRHTEKMKDLRTRQQSASMQRGPLMLEPPTHPSRVWVPGRLVQSWDSTRQCWEPAHQPSGCIRRCSRIQLSYGTAKGSDGRAPELLR